MKSIRYEQKNAHWRNQWALPRLPSLFTTSSKSAILFLAATFKNGVQRTGWAWKRAVPRPSPLLLFRHILASCRSDAEVCEDPKRDNSRKVVIKEGLPTQWGADRCTNNREYSQDFAVNSICGVTVDVLSPARSLATSCPRTVFTLHVWMKSTTNPIAATAIDFRLIIGMCASRRRISSLLNEAPVFTTNFSSCVVKGGKNCSRNMLCLLLILGFTLRWNKGPVAFSIVIFWIVFYRTETVNVVW